MEVRIQNKVYKLNGRQNQYFYETKEHHLSLFKDKQAAEEIWPENKKGIWTRGWDGVPTIKQAVENLRILNEAGAGISETDLFCWALHIDHGDPYNSAVIVLFEILNKLNAEPIDN